MIGGLNIIDNAYSKKKNKYDGNLVSFFRNSIKGRLFVFFILIGILPILIVGFIPYQKTAKIVKSQMLEFAQITIDQLNENINYHLNEMDLMSRMVYYQTFVSFQKEGGFTASNSHSFQEFLLALKNNRTFIDEIHVLVGEQYFTTAIDLKKDLLEEKEWYKTAIANPEEKLWVGPHQNDYSINEPQTEDTISLVYPFALNGPQMNATIIVEMKQNKLDELFQSPALKSLGKILLIDKYGHILYSTDELLLNDHQASTKKYITNTNLLSSLNQDNNFIYAINYLSGWKVAAFVPNDKVNQSFSVIRNTVFALIGILLIISILMGWGLSNRLFKPLKKLQMDMRQVRKGKFYTRSTIDSNDEIGELSRNFNRMVEEIEGLIERIADNERKKKAIEMQSLQYQINPHFLYNTLNSVQWLAKLYKAPEISEMLTSLIKLLRASLNTSSYTHMLEEELEILSYYIGIQRYRYDQQFEVHYQVDPDVLAILVPRFVLQPLIENSFFHGFSDGVGEIVVNAHRIGDMVKIIVEDNGRGIPEEKLDTILSPFENRKHSSGIGIKNVDDKIKLYFGEEYGLSIHSEEGQGTQVIISLPYLIKSGGEDPDVKSLISG